MIIITFAFMFAAFCMKGQTAERFSYAAVIGTGIAMNEPAHTPFTVHVLGYYNISERFSAGVGTGLSFYEIMLIPLFADAKFALTQPGKFTPFVECGGGYAFATGANAHGGLFFNPSAGIQYALTNKMKLQFSAGYELQKLGRLKEYANEYITVGFMEKLNHNSISIKVGVVF